MEAKRFFPISFNFRFTTALVVEDSKICVFGELVSDPNRCAVMMMDSKRTEEVIANTDYRAFGAVACLNGELVSYLH